MPRTLSLNEQQLLEDACAAFGRSTRIFKAIPGRARRASDGLTDGTIRFELAGKKFEMPVFIKTRADASGILLAQHRLYATKPGEHRRRLMLVAPYIGSELAARLIDGNVPFLDAAGNAFISEPEGTVMVTGRAKPQLLHSAPTARATTRKGLQVMFAIATQPGLVSQPYRAIAQASGVALSTVNQVIDDLQSRGLVALRSNGERIFTDWPKLVQEWISLYPSRLRPKLGARRFASATADWWRTFDFAQFKGLLGSEAAADVLTHALKAASVTIYSQTALDSQFMLKARLRPDPRGDVEILEAFWPGTTASGWQAGDPPLVHPLLIYADLVASGDDRNLSAAQRIYEQYLSQP
ncbi:type IV toxin-antitoxin system AbiEi family antitoxin [Paraburkholderia lacunae]|uniref:HTH crp-type domain-containing protein n=1 Tax=Paraburkholderia lacunae TaxID=2211104 RepID=A0A370N0F2_9BURK|nr:type IV toxin-antitoxin system AbiEi family antitoxin [Paraburkholderia lacunae]RDJ99076.1 hypothetical protein DLM46_30285 [Paraburkholderia lacunae]